MEPSFYQFRRVSWFRPYLGQLRADEDQVSPVDKAESAPCNKEQERLLTRLLSKLPEAQRVAFVLFEIDGYSSEEIASLMGVSVQTISTRIHKARARLAASLIGLRDCERSAGP
jgi:RNA polymerase sigma-70 factor (ECF subfamily)